MDNKEAPKPAFGVFGGTGSLFAPQTASTTTPSSVSTPNPFASPQISSLSSAPPPYNIFGSKPAPAIKFATQTPPSYESKTAPFHHRPPTTRYVSPFSASSTLFSKPAFSSTPPRAENPPSGLFGMPASLPVASTKPPRGPSSASTLADPRFKGNLTWVRPTTSTTTPTTMTTTASVAIFGQSQTQIQAPRLQLDSEVAQSLSDQNSSEQRTLAFGIPRSVPEAVPVVPSKPKLANEEPVIKGSNIFAKAITAVAGSTGAGEGAKPRPRRLSTKKATNSTTSPPKRNTFPTPEEKKMLKTLVCQQVPEELNDGKRLREHFGQFGKVLRVFPFLPKGQATVSFETHEAAERAKTEGTELQPGVKIKIFWKKITRPKEVVKTSTDIDTGKKVGSEDASILEELNIMRGSLIDPVKLERRTLGGTTLAPTKKLLQADVPSPRSVSPVKELPSSADVAQLQSLLRQPALTPVAKSDLLDARDKLVRLFREKLKGGILKKNLVGTCPDMCPEKERYSREEKRRIASYELLYADKDKEYAVDHRRAVKEYSRSSADQEEPLSHELRPGPVLTMTMDYIVSCILDKSEAPDENLAEWYHFVWDRTRSIRKEITQQNLCDLEGVSLVEKCARFHLHCTARLCEMDAQFFDQKINDENLTKCLQTLKHLYYDLSLKNVPCPNEAEFRAYDVLLHLNEGDILREVQQLSPAIRASKEVGGALKFFSALNSRNYIRFFRLAYENEDYLQCCILQRYFAQVRGKSLEIISRAYCPSSKVMPYPLSTVVAQLGYENAQEAAVFCRHHNLAVDEEADILHLDKNAFTYPDFQIALTRSFKLIESKRTKSVGEVVQKGPVPADPSLTHVPHNSFDENGYLKKEAWNAEDQKPGYVPGTALEQREHVHAPAVAQAPPSKPVFSELALRNVAAELLSSVVDQIVTELGQEIIQARQQAYLRLKAMDGVLVDMIDSLTSAVAAATYHEAVQERLQQQREADQRRLRLQALREQESQVIFETIVASVTQHELQQIAQTEISLLRSERDQRRMRVTERVSTELWVEFVQEECRMMASTEIRDRKRDRQEKVAFMLAKVAKRRSAWAWRVWRKFCQTKQHLRYMVKTFPAFHSTATWKEQSRALRSPGERVAPKRRTGFVELNESWNTLGKLTAMEACCTRLEETIMGQKLDLGDVIKDSVQASSSAKVQWKLVCLHEKRSAMDIDFADLLNVGDIKRDSEGWYVKDERVYDNGRILEYCVRYVEEEQACGKALRGAHGVVLVSDNDSWCENLIERMQNLAPNFRNLPFVVLTSKNDWGMESDANIRFYATNWRSRPHALILLEKSLKWLFTQKTPNIPEGMRFDHLPYVVEDYYYERVTTVWFASLARRKAAGLLHPSPDVLIGFANGALRHLAKALESKSLQCLSWPATEFQEHLDWNKESYRQQLSKVVTKSLTLPPWKLNECDSWADVCDQVWNYVNEVKLDNNASEFYSKVAHLICWTEINYRDLVHKVHEAKLPRFLPHDELDLDLEPEADFFPWTDMIQACLDYRMQSLNTWSKVGVMLSELADFQWPLDWQKTFSLTTRKNQVALNESLEKSLKRKSDSCLNETRNRKFLRTKLQEDVLDQSLRVLEEARYEKAMDSEFETKLSAWLQEDSGPASSTPTRAVRTPARLNQPSFLEETSERGPKRTLQDLQHQLNYDREESEDFERYLESVIMSDA